MNWLWYRHVVYYSEQVYKNYTFLKIKATNLQKLYLYVRAEKQVNKKFFIQ